MDAGFRQRTTQQVLEDHLKLRREGNLDADLERNYSEDCVLLTGYGIFHGHDGVRQSADRLKSYVADGSYQYKTCLSHSDMGFLEWEAHDENNAIKDGADSYLIRDGQILVQTIHYRVADS